MIQVGLTGGIASGKSYVAGLLGELGATIIDSDVIAREVVARGSEGLAAVVARFGSGVLSPDGTLERRKLGSIVFSDDAARADLNAIVHPRVRGRAAELAAAATSEVVVNVIPLLVETGQQRSFDGVVVVDVPEDVQLRRLMRRDHLSRDEATARIRSQASRADRLAAATWVIDSSGTREQTRLQVEELWREWRDDAAEGPELSARSCRSPRR